MRKVKAGRAIVDCGGTNYTVPSQSTVKFKVGAVVEFRADVAVTRRISKKGRIPGFADDLLDTNGLGRNAVATSRGAGEKFEDFLDYESVKRKVREVVLSDDAFRKRLAFSRNAR